MRLKVRDEYGDVSESYLITDRPDVGPEIQQVDAPLCEAGTSAPLDVGVGHCGRCLAGDDVPVGELLGLSPDELRKLCNWRTAKQDGVSSAEMGQILDKVVELLDATRVCDRETARIVLEVEPTP